MRDGFSPLPFSNIRMGRRVKGFFALELTFLVGWDTFARYITYIWLMCPVPCSLGFARGHSPFAFPLRSDFCWRDGYLPYSRSPWACERALPFHISLGFPLFLARRPSCHIPLGLQKDKALSHFPLGLDLFVGWATIVALFPPGFARGQSPFAFPLGLDLFGFYL